MLILFIIPLVTPLVSSHDFGNDTHIQTKGVKRNPIKRQINNGYQFVDCVLPQYPENGKWEVIGGNGSPKSTILPNTLIRFSCNYGYTLKPLIEYFVCNEDWNPKKMPKCEEQLCGPLKSSSTTIVKCQNHNGEPTTCSKPMHGSTATITCAPYFEIMNRQETKVQCTENKWSKPISKCKPVCGIPLHNQDPISYNTADTNLSYPWVAIIYRKFGTEKNFFCTGTLISETVIITAAHCVSNPNNETNESDYEIGIGKTFNNYGDSRDIAAQYVQVKSIVVHPWYNSSEFIADIALLKTKTTVRVSAYVQPICLNSLNKSSIPHELTKYIAMWGRQTDGSVVEHVRYLSITQNENECESQLPPKWLTKYKTNDKKCISFEKGANLPCTGFSGGGLIFKNSEDNRYYLYGFVVLAPYNIKTKCAETPVLSIRLSHYYDFINENLGIL